MPPATDEEDIAYYFPDPQSCVLFYYAYFSAVSFNLRRPNDITTFGKSFSESFLNFAITLNPSSADSSDVTPPWGLWMGGTEMLFNVTEAGAPDIHSVTTSDALLKRCE